MPIFINGTLFSTIVVMSLVQSKILFVLYLMCIPLIAFSQEYKLSDPIFKSGYSDFSPCYRNSQLVFTSTMPTVYSKKEVANIFYYKDGEFELVSPKLSSSLHDGPASFTGDGNIICYSSNQNGVVSENQKLNIGLYFSYFENGDWSDPEEFQFNSPGFSNAYPSLSADGNTLIFSSTRPGGYGGTDLYVCYKTDDGWSQPQNLGGKINSELNESFPYLHSTGRLYFSSNAGTRYGGLDIFYSDSLANGWTVPEALPSPLNSNGDDFGIVFDANQANGYISSSRKKGRDMIYPFILQEPKSKKCESIAFEPETVTFFESGPEGDKNISHLNYIWEVNNETFNSNEVSYTFKQPGSYTVKLFLCDSLLRDTTMVAEYSHAVKYKSDIEISFHSSPSNDYLMIDKVNLSNNQNLNYVWTVNDTRYVGRKCPLSNDKNAKIKLYIASNDEKLSYRCYEIPTAAFTSGD